MLTYTSVTGFAGGKVQLVNEPDRQSVASCRAQPGDGDGAPARRWLFTELEQMRDRWEAAGIASVTRIGDCWAPSTIQQAVYSGHKWARELDEAPEGLTPRELPIIESGE